MPVTLSAILYYVAAEFPYVFMDRTDKDTAGTQDADNLIKRLGTRVTMGEHS